MRIIIFKIMTYILKRPLIIMHADIFFDYKLIENVKNSYNKNIISCVLKERNKIKVNGWTIKADSHNLIKELKKKSSRKSKSTREVACINKFSVSAMKYIFRFMKNFFLKNGKNYTWEILLNEIIKHNQIKIYTNNYKSYWANINTQNDYMNLKKIKI